MTHPSDASLRRVGLAWYAEDVPAHCSTRRYVDGGILFAPMSRECALAITGKQENDTFTQEDYDAIADYLRHHGNKMVDGRWLKLVVEQAGIMGKPFSTLEQSSKIWDIGTPIDDAADSAGDVADTVGDAVGFLTDPMTFLAVGGLVIGLGMVGLGALRLLR